MLMEECLMTDYRLVLTPLSDIKIAGQGNARPEWGPWHIDRESCVLWTDAPGYRYEIDLKDCTTSARVLDGICQIAGKQWKDRNCVIAGLVTALDDVLNPQAHLCSFGRPGQLSSTAIRALVGKTT
jgi:hypothetical protein